MPSATGSDYSAGGLVPIPRIVSAPAFLTVFFCAGGALALWVDARLADRGPSSIRSLILLVATGLLVLNVAKGMAAAMISPENPMVTLAVLFGILLPALVFVFLTTIWVLKMVRSAIPR